MKLPRISGTQRRQAPRRRGRTWLPVVERLEERTVLTFLPPRFLPAGEVTWSVATTDLNLDGRADFVVTNRGEFPGEPGDTVDIYLGNGDGTFQPSRRIQTGQNPVGLGVEDFNADGYPDVATTTYYGGNVAVMLGNGDGTFRPPVFHTVDLLPRVIFVADVNRDSSWDILVGNVGGTTISTLFGNGDGSFRPALTFEVNPGASPYFVTGAYFNADKAIDLLVVDDFAGTFSVLLNNGDGTFQAPVAYAVASYPRGAAVFDFNFDGFSDVAVVSQLNSTVSVFLGAGGTAFQAPRTYPTGNGPQHILTVDINLDGIFDLVTCNIFDNLVSLLLGNIDGTFQAPLHYPIRDYGAASATADFNGDFWPDLAIARADDPLGEAVVLINAADWWGGSPGGAGQPAPPGGDGLAQAGLALASQPVAAITAIPVRSGEDRLAGTTSLPMLGTRLAEPVPQVGTLEAPARSSDRVNVLEEAEALLGVTAWMVWPGLPVR